MKSTFFAIYSIILSFSIIGSKSYMCMHLLALLPLEIQFSLTNENATRIVSFQDLQNKGQQNIVVLAGSSAFIKDAVITAKLEGNDFFNSGNLMLLHCRFCFHFLCTCVLYISK